MWARSCGDQDNEAKRGIDTSVAASLWRRRCKHRMWLHNEAYAQQLHSSKSCVQPTPPPPHSGAPCTPRCRSLCEPNAAQPPPPAPSACLRMFCGSCSCCCECASASASWPSSAPHMASEVRVVGISDRAAWRDQHDTSSTWWRTGRGMRVGESKCRVACQSG